MARRIQRSLCDGAVGIGFGLLAAVGIASRGGQPIAALWLPNALLLGILLQRRRATAMPFVLCCCCNLVASYLGGVPAGRAIGFTAINMLEIAAVLYGSGAARRRCDLDAMHDILRFTGLAVVVPLAGGMLAAALIAPDGGAAWQLWLGWALAHGLGLLILTPIVCALGAALRRRPGLGRRELAELVAMAALSLAVSAAIFGQTRFPLLFVAGPVVVLAAFRMGTLGTAVSITVVTLVASIATARGVGPIMLVHGSAGAKMLVLQVFLATNFLMGLPIAAMLKGLEQTRRELSESRDFVRSVLENMREVTFRTDGHGRWAFLNPAWQELTGYTAAESLGSSVTALVHPDDLAKMPRRADGTLPESSFTQRFRHRDGTWRHVEVSVRPLYGEAGRLAATNGTIRDVTERVAAEAALRDSRSELAEREAQLSLLASNATDAVFRLALDGTCRYASPSVGEVIGIASKHLIGANMLARFHPDDAAAVQEGYRALAAGVVNRTVLTYRSEPMDQPGTWRWLEANCGLVRDPASGAPQELIVSIRDISERKALELDLAAARDAAEVAATAKASFLANMSHEIRTPMNGVIGATELLLDSPLTATQRGQAQVIADSGRAMMRLLNDILDLSKIDAGQMQVVCEPMDIAHAIRGCARLIAPLAEQKGLALACAIDAEVPPRIRGDGLRIRQVMLNLLGNAVKFTESGGVSLHARAVSRDGGGDQLELEVRDTGIGIAADRQAAVFDQFVQSDATTAQRYGGTGLGLTISAQLARLMGGELAMTSSAGVGTSLFLRLPLIASAAAHELPPAAAPAAPAMGLHVLLAEDHEINRMLATAMLDRLYARVVVAADGAAAIAAVRAADAAGDPFALVLMDMQMPVMDGLAATRELRAMGYAAERLPIVALTANAYADDIALCLAAGMQAHLAKPLRIADLSAALARHAVLPIAAAA